MWLGLLKDFGICITRTSCIGRYMSFLHWKIHELLVTRNQSLYKVSGCSSSISYHILSLTATMNWIHAIHQEEEDMFFIEDEDEDMLVAHYLL
jgi:hypothetical protein